MNRLCTSSNPELAEKEELFRAQHAVILPKAHLLGDVLAAYLKLKQELQDRGSRQSEAQCTAVLHKMVAKLPDVKAGLKAVEAAWQVTQKGEVEIISVRGQHQCALAAPLCVESISAIDNTSN